MRVSWLIPVRDGGIRLLEAVRSALKDSRPEDEVLVIDDGSRDPVPSDLVADSRLRVLRSEARGITAALELGRRAAQGRYLARLDADDQSLPGRLDRQVECLETRPELAVVGGRAELFCEEGESVGEGMQHFVDWVNGLASPELGLFVDAPLFHPAVLLRAEAIATLGGYRDGDFPEDYELWLRLWAQGFGLGAVTAPVVRIRDHAARLTRRDPRYRREAFEVLKRRVLRETLLRVPRRIAIWCGPRYGKPWIRWLRSEGHEVVAAIDPCAGGRRAGVPVLAAASVSEIACDLLLVAVGKRGARSLIARELADRRPEWREGVHWWALR